MCDHATPRRFFFRLHFLSKSGNNTHDNHSSIAWIKHNCDQNFAFSPENLTIRTGATVTWLNQNGAVHQIDSDKKTPVAFTSDALGNGESFSFTFTQPGTYTYLCLNHPPMKGTIIVQS
jgi:plastocyanin